MAVTHIDSIPPAEIGIVLLNYKTYAETIRLVHDLQKQRGVLLRIVVVDNCSPNDSFVQLQKALKTFPNVTVLAASENAGYAAGNNLGLEFFSAAPPRFVAVMNNDIFLDDEELLAKMAAYRERLPNPGFIAPRQTDASGKDIPVERRISYWQDLLLCFFLFRLLQPHLPLTCRYRRDMDSEPVYIIPGSFLFAEYGFFKSIGFFDPGTFLYGEERILAFKTKAAGYQNYILPQLAYRHIHAMTIRSEINSLNRYRIYFKSILYYEKTYRRAGWLPLQLLKLFQLWGILELKVLGLFLR